MSKRKKSPQAKRVDLVRKRSGTTRVTAAIRADGRGSKVLPTIASYEKAAGEDARRVAEALIARHNARMVNAQSIPDWLRGEILSCLVPIIQLDRALRDLGANPGRHPSSSANNSQIDNLAWGVDSLVAAGRLLLCGQTAGAAAIARNQLEVWTASRASIGGLYKNTGERDSDFIARVWSQPVGSVGARRNGNVDLVFDDSELYVEITDPTSSHRHVALKNGAELCPAMLWMVLSELLHGREFVDASAWDAACLADNEMGQTADAVMTVLDALRLTTFHIRNMLLASALDLHLDRTADLLKVRLEEFSPADQARDTSVSARAVDSPPPNKIVGPPVMHMAPLLPNEGLATPVLNSMAWTASNYEHVMKGGRPAGRLFRDDELVTTMFGWHRFRSALAARDALHREQKALGSEFDPSGLKLRATAWIFVTEAAALLSTWLPRGSRRDAASLMASALRSSWWLWLEDDDRAMAVLRSVLEQGARLRVSRLKPEKAERLEGRATPRDWLENAGWRRLGPLNTALGEFAHLTARSDWTKARALLTNIQNEPDSEVAPFTARRAAVELVTLLVAAEVREQVREFSPLIAAAFGELFQDVGATRANEDAFLNERLNFIWSFRERTSTRVEPISEVHAN